MVYQKNSDLANGLNEVIADMAKDVFPVEIEDIYADSYQDGVLLYVCFKELVLDKYLESRYIYSDGSAGEFGANIKKWMNTNVVEDIADAMEELGYSFKYVDATHEGNNRFDRIWHLKFWIKPLTSNKTIGGTKMAQNSETDKIVKETIDSLKESLNLAFETYIWLEENEIDEYGDNWQTVRESRDDLKAALNDFVYQISRYRS